MDGKKKFDDTSKKFRKRIEEEKAKQKEKDMQPTQKNGNIFSYELCKTPSNSTYKREIAGKNDKNVCKENQPTLKNKYISSNKENIPPTPGNDVVYSPMYAPPNYHIDNLGNKEQEPWFSPLYGEPEVPMTPGKSNNDAYSPPCDRCNSNDCSEEELLSRPEDDKSFVLHLDTSTIHYVSGNHHQHQHHHQNRQHHHLEEKEEAGSPLTSKTKDNNFCGHMGYQRSIIYRFWVDQAKQYPEIDAEANANKENQYLDSPSSSQLSWLEVSPNPRLVTTTPASMRRLSQSSADKLPSLTPKARLINYQALRP
ncbi:hypothetical protein FF38_01119 [Lucilia cuprina]|uniref:Uncharacterized protein n=1 Tax=Lucilia cuprina TaxID=7375 RepID=A0A0L0C7J2_LUCCU|nr:hypothetical protein FF38_01119 [Lucilia cuprina]